MQWNHVKSFKFEIFYDLETKVKALVIIQWKIFGNRSIFEQAACFWKETVVLGTQCKSTTSDIFLRKFIDTRHSLVSFKSSVDYMYCSRCSWSKIFWSCSTLITIFTILKDYIFSKRSQICLKFELVWLKHRLRIGQRLISQRYSI